MVKQHGCNRLHMRECTEVGHGYISTFKTLDFVLFDTWFSHKQSTRTLKTHNWLQECLLVVGNKGYTVSMHFWYGHPVVGVLGFRHAVLYPLVWLRELLQSSNLPLNSDPTKLLGVFQEEFLQDLVDFLGSRGHGRLSPPAGFDAFPEVVLNGKRLDLYNLYREVSMSLVTSF